MNDSKKFKMELIKGIFNLIDEYGAKDDEVISALEHIKFYFLSEKIEMAKEEAKETFKTFKGKK